MKLNFPIFAFLIILLAACGGKPEKVSDIPNASAEDSLMFYYGQMNGNNYWYDAQSDTILKTEEARRDFLEGFMAGLKNGKDNDPYNKGLQLGAKLASRVHDFEKAYNLNLPHDVLIASMEAALNNDSSIDITDAQLNFYKLKDRFEVDKGIREGGLAKESLRKAASKGGMTMINDTLYFKSVSPGKGTEKFKAGDNVELTITASTFEGNAIAKQFPPKIKMGEGRVPEVVRIALLTMTDGETRLFLTTPHALLGRRFEKYFISAQDPVYFTVKAERLPANASLDNTPPATTTYTTK